jgi:hypothetical protein
MVGTFLNEPSDGLKKIRVTTREVIPDTRAQIFWLKNRRPDLWRDKREVKDTSESKKQSVITIFELPNDGRNDWDYQAKEGVFTIVKFEVHDSFTPPTLPISQKQESLFCLFQSDNAQYAGVLA